MANPTARGVTAAFALFGLLLAAGADAGPLVISPTTVEIAQGRRSAVIEVQNADDQPVDLQFRAYAWDQSDGTDRLTPTTAVAVSPAIVTLPPRGKQLFRVLQLGGASGAGERSYRLRLNQIPPAPVKGVAINFEFMLPLFIGGSPKPGALSFTLERGTLALANAGDRRVRLRALTLRGADGKPQAIPQAQGKYVLAKSTARWDVPDAPAGARLIATVDEGAIDVTPASVARRQ